MFARRVKWCVLAAFVVGLAAAVLAQPSAAEPPDYSAEIKARIAWWERYYPKYTKDLGVPKPPIVSNGTGGRGYSIHIAVGEVDPDSYPGAIVPPLPATRNDLREMKALATAQGFTVLAELVDGDARRDKVLGAIRGAQAKMGAGDTLLITYSGHGSQIPDTNGDEEDGLDETWCLYDGHLIDDELIDVWAGFEAGARIVVVLDSCHSSTATREILREAAPRLGAESKVEMKGKALLKKGEELLRKSPRTARLLDKAIKQREAITKAGQYNSRLLPTRAAVAAYLAKKDIYDKRQADLKDLPALKDHSALKATVMTLAACRDEETALDDNVNGFFTRGILDVWNGGKRYDNYEVFQAAVAAVVRDRARAVPHSQNPTFNIFGATNQAFEQQAPFGVNPKEGKGYSIHIAVSEVDPAAYPKAIVDPLPGALSDLQDMKKIAAMQGFTVLAELTDKDATHDAVLAAIKGAQAKVKAGDTLLITYSGHGSQIPDTNGDEPLDGLDETWCLYDGHLIDDELVGCWVGFEAGARIVVVLDSCHSSTAAKGLAPAIVAFSPEAKKGVRVEDFLKRSARTAAALAVQMKQHAALREQKCRSRLLPTKAAYESYVAKEEVYKKRQDELKNLPELFDSNKLKATVISLAACQDDQTALESAFGGFFTKALVEVWDAGRYSKSYSEFLLEVATKVKRRALTYKDANGQPHQQDPSYRRFGAKNDPFEKMTAFRFK